jgi:DNA-directed RNA polymerase specialized sigma24 family protein
MRGSAMPSGTLDLLLARLHPDRDHAAGEYERLRARLIRFFEWKRCRAPDQLADETLDRVALRVAQGERIDKIGAFIQGVAANVCREQFQRPAEIPIEDEVLAQLSAQEARQEERNATLDALRVRRLEYQRRCLERLGPRKRDLITRYHYGRGSQRIEARRALAMEIGISLNALRIRAHWIRSALVNCVGAMERKSAAPS